MSPRALAVLRLMTSSNVWAARPASRRVWCLSGSLIHIIRRASVDVERVRPVGHEAAGLHIRPYVVHGRQAAHGRKLGEPAAVLTEHAGPL